MAEITVEALAADTQGAPSGSVTSHDVRLHLQEKGVVVDMYDRVDEDAARAAMEDFKPVQPKEPVTAEASE